MKVCLLENVLFVNDVLYGAVGVLRGGQIFR